MNLSDDSLPYDDTDGLDAGLLAAFGQRDAVTVKADPDGVLATLQSRLGFQSQILLRDDEEEGRVVKPAGHGRPDVPSATSRYQIHGEIARGGVGVVVKGRDSDLGRDVAMKVLQKRHASNPALVQRFVEEAQIAGQLQHPGILPVYELGLYDDQEPFFTMKLVKGQTLATLLRDHVRRDADLRASSVDRTRLLSIFEDVCQTIAYAHTRGVIHRDLKPSNVMVGAFGEVQVVDWGLAKVMDQGVDDREPDHDTMIETERSRDPGRQSRAGSIMGTPAYMAPEQARGETGRLDERTDVFALGAMLCEILAGAPPFSGDASAMMADAAAGRLDDALSRLEATDADHELLDIARACLAPDRDDRPASAKVVADSIRDYGASVEQRAHDAKIAAAEAATRAAQERRARRLTVAFALTVLAAVLIGGIAFTGVQKARSRRVADASERVNRALNDASLLLGQAEAAPVGQTVPWSRLADTEIAILVLLESPDVNDVTRNRATTFLADLGIARRDRAMIERIEELVIFGATHNDAESWVWMEENLRGTYVEYGLDLDSGDLETVATQIRSSPLAAQLANGLELWIATVFQLNIWNLAPRSIPEMMTWVDMLYEADPDPYRTAIRKILYMQDPSSELEAMNRLAESDEFDRALPRTKAWLASTYWRTGDLDRGLEIFERALETTPGDLMLNFDCAYYLVALERWEEATRYYHRALVARPDSGGIWRSLGIALRELDDTPGALDAFEQSIRFQPDYASSHVDRGISLDTLDRADDAMSAFRDAIRLRPDSALAHCRLGLTLQGAGRLDEALAELQLGHELGQSEFGWSHPSDEWLAECERLVAGRP